MNNRVFTFFVPLLLFSVSLLGQSTDQIAFIAFNADGNDDFAFVTLSTINANTTIFFSDNEIVNDSTLNSGEGILSWSNSNITPAGTAVIVNNASSSSSITTNLGAVASVSGNFNLSASGDGLIAYEGPTEDQVSHWLSAIENSNNKVGNIQLTNLIQDQSYIQFHQTSSPDGGAYTGIRNGAASYLSYKAFINDANNWQEDVSNGLSILPISAFPFTTVATSSTQLLLETTNPISDTIPLQGDTAHHIAAFKVKSANGSTSIMDISFSFSGTYQSSDFISFQLRTSTGSVTNSALLAQISSDSLTNDSLGFRNLNLSFNNNDSLVLHLLAKIDTNAIIGSTFQVNSLDLNISLGTVIDSSHFFQVHHIEALKPITAYRPLNLFLNQDSIMPDSSNYLTYALQVKSQYKSVNLLSLTANLQGNLASSDIDFFKLWHSADTLFNPQEDQLLAAANLIDTNGAVEFRTINYGLAKNEWQTFFISVDLSCAAQLGKSFRISALDSSNFKFDQSVGTSGYLVASSHTTIVKASVPLVKNISWHLLGTEVSINWANSNCIDETLVFIHDHVFNDSLSGSYSVNSNYYSDQLNDTLASGAVAVYAGLFKGAQIKGLKAGKNYYCSIYNRQGNRYSQAKSFSFYLADDPALIISQYYEGQSNDKWIEISNVGDTAIDLSEFYLARWSNTSTPSGAASSSNQLSGILLAGNSLLMQHSSATNPLYASGTSGGSLAFNGNDAMAICRISADWENRIDCIYSNGYWGANTSFYRKAWVLDPNRGQSLLDGLGEWIEVNISLVDSSGIGQTTRLGEHESGLATGDFTYNGSVWLPQDPNGISTNQNSIVIQSGTATFSANLNCSYLQVLQQARLNVSNAAIISIQDSLNNEGVISISGNASILQQDTGLVNPNSGQGSFIFHKVYEATAVDRFKFWSSPLKDALIENSFSNTNPLDRYYFHPGGLSPGYKSYPAGKMEAGKAYALTPNIPSSFSQVNFQDSVIFRGDSLLNGRVSIEMDSLSPGDYVFLGNPYPSPIDYQLFLAENPSLNSSVWYWDASPNDKSNSAFAVWNNQGAISIGHSKKASPTNIIPAMQGFIVRMGQNFSSNSNYIFTFNNGMRVGAGSVNPPFFKTSSYSVKIKLGLRSQKSESYCLISSENQASAEFDEKFDAPIYKANQNQSFYSLAADKQLSIQALDLKPTEVQIVPLGIDAWHTGSYTIMLDTSSRLDSSTSITLIDSLMSFERDLRSQAYSFQITSLGPDTNRFYLKIGEEKNDNLSSAFTESLDWEVWQNSRGQLEIKLVGAYQDFDSAELYNSSSQLIEQWTLSPGENHYSLNFSESRSGIFYLSLGSKGKQSKAVKVFLRQ